MKTYLYFKMGLFFLKHADKLKAENHLSDAKKFYHHALWMLEEDRSGTSRASFITDIKAKIAAIDEVLSASFDVANVVKFFSTPHTSIVLFKPSEDKTEQKTTDAFLYVPQGQGALLQKSSQCNGLMTNRFIKCLILIGIDLVNKKIIMIHADGTTPLAFINASFAKLSPQAMKIVCYKDIKDAEKTLEERLGKDLVATFLKCPLDLSVEQLTVRLDGLLSVDPDLFSDDVVKTNNMKCVDAASYLVNCFINNRPLIFRRLLGDDAAVMKNYPSDIVVQTFANLEAKLKITPKSSIAHAINQLSIAVRDGRIPQGSMYGDFGIGVLVLLGESSQKSPAEQLADSFLEVLNRISSLSNGKPTKGFVYFKKEVTAIANEPQSKLKAKLIEGLIKKYIEVQNDPNVFDNVFFTFIRELKMCFDAYVIRQWYINWEQPIANIQNQKDKSESVSASTVLRPQ